MDDETWLASGWPLTGMPPIGQDAISMSYAVNRTERSLPGVVAPTCVMSSVSQSSADMENETAVGVILKAPLAIEPLNMIVLFFLTLKAMPLPAGAVPTHASMDVKRSGWWAYHLALPTITDSVPVVVAIRPWFVLLWIADAAATQKILTDIDGQATAAPPLDDDKIVSLEIVPLVALNVPSPTSN